MADTIEIVPSGDHGNSALESSGQTRRLANVSGGRVPLEHQAKGSPIDVSGYSTLRAALTVSKISNRVSEDGEIDAQLYVTLEHQVNGRWEVLHAFDPMVSRATQRFVTGAFEGLVRASWYFLKLGSPVFVVADEVAFEWSLVAEALPEAA